MRRGDVRHLELHRRASGRRAGECDAGYDLYAALGGTIDGRWSAGTTADGTHPSEALQIAAAADLAPRLAALLGF